MRTLIVLWLLAAASLLTASAAELEAAWAAGNPAQLRQALQSRAATANDRAAKAYYNAISQPRQASVKTALDKLIRDFPSTRYAARARLRLAQMALLQRDADTAARHLQLVDATAFPEAHYWLAFTRLTQSDWARCIQSAQAYIATSADTLLTETAWFTIAEAYSRKGDYNRALSTLHSIKSSEALRNQPLLLFQLGYCHEMLGDYTNAKKYYRHLMVEYAYTLHAYRAEDRMLALRNRPDANLNVTDFSICDQDRESATLEREEQAVEPGTERVLRFWLQVGAFSTAERATGQARQMEERGYPAGTFCKVVGGKQWQVAAVGPFTDRSVALETKQKLSDEGVSSMLLQRY
ncbi:MAG: tetratricopeptide repeat protein [Candidatus Cloacimonetes bacterium]|nr:tetratricopeptide repeat protein [Candidatus Cloacimonadota bacterium]